jgi:catechol 2,3-dioxygenase-like lactoylglutathione lyase family enzyme
MGERCVNFRLTPARCQHHGMTPTEDTVVDLVPFVHVTDVARSISFYEALGFRVVKRYEPNGRLEFAGLEATSSAKLMLARVSEVPEPDPDQPGPGFLYLYTPDLDAFRERLIRNGIAPGEIDEGRVQAQTASCACGIPTAMATWWPSCSRGRSGAVRTADGLRRPSRERRGSAASSCGRRLPPAARRLWGHRRGPREPASRSPRGEPRPAGRGGIASSSARPR